MLVPKNGSVVRIVGVLGANLRSGPSKSFQVVGVTLILVGAVAFSPGMMHWAHADDLPEVPECSAQPSVSDAKLVGTDCDDVILVPANVQEVSGGGGDDQIIAVPGVVKIDGGDGDDVIGGSVTVTEIDGGSRQRRDLW